VESPFFLDRNLSKRRFFLKKQYALIINSLLQNQFQKQGFQKILFGLERISNVSIRVKIALILV